MFLSPSFVYTPTPHEQERTEQSLPPPFSTLMSSRSTVITSGATSSGLRRPLRALSSAAVTNECLLSRLLQSPRPLTLSLPPTVATASTAASTTTLAASSDRCLLHSGRHRLHNGHRHLHNGLHRCANGSLSTPSFARASIGPTATTAEAAATFSTGVAGSHDLAVERGPKLAWSLHGDATASPARGHRKKKRRLPKEIESLPQPLQPDLIYLIAVGPDLAPGQSICCSVASAISYPSALPIILHYGVGGFVFRNENSASNEDSYIENYLNHISNGVLADDRRSAMIDLQSLVAESQTAQITFGTMGQILTRQIITALLTHSPNRIQEAIISITCGITTVMNMLMDREMHLWSAVLHIQYVTSLIWGCNPIVHPNDQAVKLEDEANNYRNLAAKLESDYKSLSDAYNSLEQFNFRLESTVN
ncbi:hypothetical protein ZIOFF_023812 [Zingiber officinale]|uniref:Uncharacterized protein n=1 Tax=Zingiber officinale TaxID=94328 RepID=A0A8J5LFS0_ZINOF|nr:hypothetical protein ZIOFF_023812 [Zingiber officinale]